MRSVVGRSAALVLATAAFAAGAEAQPARPSDELPSVAAGTLDPPTHAIPGTINRLFDDSLAPLLGDVLSQMRRAVIDCDRVAWLKGSTMWLRAVDRKQRESEGGGSLHLRAHANEDGKTLRAFYESAGFPAYALNCPPPRMAPLAKIEDLPTMETGRLGLPESVVEGTPIAVFDTLFAWNIADALVRLRNAGRHCDRNGYMAAIRNLNRIKEDRAAETASGDGRDLVARGQAAADTILVEAYVQENWIRYPLPCTPERDRR